MQGDDKMLLKTDITQKNGEKRNIGIYDTESKVWLVERNKKKHYMKTLRGWGLDEWMYEKLKNDYGLERVVMTETTSKKVYECRTEVIEENKIFKTFHPYRLQVFVPKIYWKLIDDGKKF